MAHTSGGSASGVGPRLACLRTTWHLRDLSLVFEVSVVVFVEVRLCDDGLLIKQAFCKSVIFTLNSLSFLLANSQIQTCWLIDAGLRLRSNSFAGLS